MKNIRSSSQDLSEAGFKLINMNSPVHPNAQYPQHLPHYPPHPVFTEPLEFPNLGYGVPPQNGPNGDFGLESYPLYPEFENNNPMYYEQFYNSLEAPNNYNPNSQNSQKGIPTNSNNNPMGEYTNSRGIYIMPPDPAQYLKNSYQYMPNMSTQGMNVGGSGVQLPTQQPLYTIGEDGFTKPILLLEEDPILPPPTLFEGPKEQNSQAMRCMNPNPKNTKNTNRNTPMHLIPGVYPNPNPHPPTSRMPPLLVPQPIYSHPPLMHPEQILATGVAQEEAKGGGGRGGRLKAINTLKNMKNMKNSKYLDPGELESNGKGDLGGKLKVSNKTQGVIKREQVQLGTQTIIKLPKMSSSEGGQPTSDNLEEHVDYILKTARHFSRGIKCSRKNHGEKEMGKKLNVVCRKRKSSSQIACLEQALVQSNNEFTHENILQLADITGLTELQIYKWSWDQKKKTDKRPKLNSHQKSPAP